MIWKGPDGRSQTSLHFNVKNSNVKKHLNECILLNTLSVPAYEAGQNIEHPLIECLQFFIDKTQTTQNPSQSQI